MKTILKVICLVAAGLILFVAIDTGLFMMKDGSLRTRALAAIEKGTGRRHDRILPSVMASRVGPELHFGGAGDFHYAIAGNYEVWCSSAAEVRISPRIFDDSTPIIPSRVTEVAWDDRFVVARQDIKANHDNARHGIRGVVDSPTRSQYWILDVSGPHIHGPYALMQLAGERRRLGVPDTLMLRPVTSYLPHHSTNDMIH